MYYHNLLQKPGQSPLVYSKSLKMSTPINIKSGWPNNQVGIVEKRVHFWVFFHFLFFFYLWTTTQNFQTEMFSLLWRQTNFWFNPRQPLCIRLLNYKITVCLQVYSVTLYRSEVQNVLIQSFSNPSIPSNK